MKEENRKDLAVALRILDVNANRCAEGLRVVEEIARFSIEDERITGRLKGIRHEVRSSVRALAGGTLGSRNSVEDVGRASATRSEISRGSLGSVARANFARAEEALRVLEEFGKLVDEDASREFKSLRFELYSVESDFFQRSGDAAAMPRSPFLYAILDRSVVAHRDVSSVAEALVAGGADMIQYRAKETGEAEMRRDLAVVLAVARTKSIPVIVNDHVDLAHETGADGAHVGAQDTSPAEARILLGPGRIVGVTVLTLDDLERSSLDAVDYLGIAAIFPSPTKPSVASVGVEFIRRVRSRTQKPLVAVGGIRPENAALALAAGADGIASVSALLEGDVRKNCFTFKEIIGKRLQR